MAELGSELRSVAGPALCLAADVLIKPKNASITVTASADDGGSIAVGYMLPELMQSIKQPWAGASMDRIGAFPTDILVPILSWSTSCQTRQSKRKKG